MKLFKLQNNPAYIYFGLADRHGVPFSIQQLKKNHLHTLGQYLNIGSAATGTGYYTNDEGKQYKEKCIKFSLDHFSLEDIARILKDTNQELALIEYTTGQHYFIDSKGELAYAGIMALYTEAPAGDYCQFNNYYYKLV